ncbi:MAG: hypothetical protein ACRC20_05430 [Segniliparus sp.]|uniref:hypothetical protein n=1 Tax=Segniliparus sp. TaxID=2804064 RepID=UPI003F2B33DA
MKQDEETITGWLGPLTRIENPGDMTALAGQGYMPIEQGMKSREGHGVFFYHQAQLTRELLVAPGIITGGFPTVLLYAPEDWDSPQINSGEPYQAVYPYHLVGWNYWAQYTPGFTPLTRGLCINTNDWAVLDKGTFALPWMESYITPPDEEWQGQRAPHPDLPMIGTNPMGDVHGRVWFVQMFMNPHGGPPKLAGVDPFEYIPGEPDDQAGFTDGFFKPEHPPSDH